MWFFILAFPKAPTNVSVTDVTADTVNLKWVSGNVGSNDESYVIKYKKFATNDAFISVERHSWHGILADQFESIHGVWSANYGTKQDRNRSTKHSENCHGWIRFVFWNILNFDISLSLSLSTSLSLSLSLSPSLSLSSLSLLTLYGVC